MVSRDLGGLISGGTITSHRTALRRNSTFVDLDITLLVGLSEVLGRAVTDMRISKKANSRKVSSKQNSKPLRRQRRFSGAQISVS